MDMFTSIRNTYGPKKNGLKMGIYSEKEINRAKNFRSCMIKFFASPFCSCMIKVSPCVNSFKITFYF